MMPRSLARMVVTPSALAIRLFPLLVALCVLVFPAYKRMALGYVPLVVGAVAAGWLIWAKRDPAMDWKPGLGALYLLPLLIQVALLMIFRPEPLFDGLYVYRHAVELVQTGRMDPMTYYPPAMTWWYAGWFWWLGASPLLAQLSHIPLSLGVTWTTLQLAREVTGQDGTSRRIAFASAWYPTSLGYVLTTPYYHYLYTLLTVLMVWLLLRFWNRAWSPGVLMLAGVCAGWGALTKAVQLVAPLQVGCWLLLMMCASRWTGASLRRWMLGGALFVMGMMLVLLPWMMRNWHTFHDVVPVCTSGGLVLYSANNPDSNGLYSDGPDKVVLATPADMLAHSRWCAAQAKAFMRNQPELFAPLVWRKFLHTWGSEATFTELINWRGRTTSAIKRGFSFVFLAGWAALVFLWVGQSVRLMRERYPLTACEALVGVLILSNAFIYVVFEGGDRHHLPLVPLILVLVGSRLGKTAGAEPAISRGA